ncbi:MAG: 16S rRNA processing protein RimM [Firmicutes bacterium]|nr:16S rRNA processing protein RimM [Bacillota bacterium]
MNEIYLGKIVNTHGIKGEVRIISDFELKNQVFKKDFNLYVGRDRVKLPINSYRPHKNYDMVTFVGITDINEVLVYKGEPVYINREDLEISDYILKDLIGLEVYNKEHLVGTIDEIINNGAHKILVVKSGKRKNLIPFVDDFISDVDINGKKVFINEIEGLINED